MNIQGYQAKKLLAKSGGALPLQIPVKSLDEIRSAADEAVGFAEKVHRNFFCKGSGATPEPKRETRVCSPKEINSY